MAKTGLIAHCQGAIKIYSIIAFLVFFLVVAFILYTHFLGKNICTYQEIISVAQNCIQNPVDEFSSIILLFMIAFIVLPLPPIFIQFLYKEFFLIKKQSGWIHFFIRLCRRYIIITSWLVMFWISFLMAMYMDEYHLDDYCLWADPKGAHDFIINSSNACTINWMFFINEPFLVSVLMFLILIGPIALLGFFLKRSLKNNAAVSA